MSTRTTSEPYATNHNEADNPPGGQKHIHRKKGIGSELTPAGHHTSTTPPPLSQGTSKGSEALSELRKRSKVISCPQATNKALRRARREGVLEKMSVVTSLQLGNYTTAASKIKPGSGLLTLLLVTVRSRFYVKLN